MADAFFDSHRDRIVELSVQNKISGCYPWPDYVFSGGLMSYGTNLSDSYRQAGIYVGRILRGEKPSDLPVMQPIKIHLVLSLKTAKQLGIPVPPSLLVTYWAARKAAPDLPIVFTVVLDPIAAGMIDSMQHPGGKSTGCTNFDPEQIGEQIRLLKRVVPGLRRLAVLGDAGVPDILPRLARAAAEKNGLGAHIVLLKGKDDLARAFAEFTANGAEALLGLEVPRVTTYGDEIVRLAAATRLPAIFGNDHARFRPLMAYGTSYAAAARCMAVQVDEVLRGTEAGEISVRSVRQPELIIDLNAAREMGISLPDDLVSSAHKVRG